MFNMKTIKELAARRYVNQNREAALRGFKPVKREEYLGLLEESYFSGFKCGYCKEQMLLEDTPPYFHVASIDHKLPLDLGGRHEISNMIVVCHRCNIIKGTLTEDTFRKFLSLLSQDPFLKIKLFDEYWRGRFANKISRENTDKFQCEKCGWINELGVDDER